MTTPMVLDASAAIHMVLAAEHARSLVEHLEQADSVAVPDLFFSELGNGLWKYVQFGSLPLEEALMRLEEASDLVESVVPARALVQEAVVAAAEYRHPVYDMLYAVLARREGAKILTTDRTFAGILRRMEIETYCPIE